MAALDTSSVVGHQQFGRPVHSMAPSRRFSSALARTSAFPRTEAHLVQHTAAGAVVTLCGALLMVLLLTAELRDFLNVRSTKKVGACVAVVCPCSRLCQLGVDSRRGLSELPMFLDVSFRAVPCSGETRGATYLAQLQLTLRALCSAHGGVCRPGGDAGDGFARQPGKGATPAAACCVQR